MAELTTKIIFEQQIAKTLKDHPDRVSEIRGIYQFNISGDNGGFYFVDLTGSSPKVCGGTADSAQVTLTATDTDFLDMYLGQLNTQMAFMIGKLKIAGNMALAMKLQSLIA